MFFEIRSLQPELKPEQDSQLTLYHILVPIFGGFIIIINLAVVVSSGLILKKHQTPKCTYLFLGNVALSDTITGIAVILGAVYPKHYRDHYQCAVQLGMIVSSTLASIYSVGLIAVDRYLYILHGILYRQWMFPFRARMLIIGVWVIGFLNLSACIIGFLPLMGWYGDTDNGRVCWFIFLAPPDLILLTVLMGLLSIIVVIVLNSLILRSALKTISRIQRCEQSTATSTSSLRMSKSTSSINHLPPSDLGDVSRENSGKPTKWKAVSKSSSSIKQLPPSDLGDVSRGNDGNPTKRKFMFKSTNQLPPSDVKDVSRGSSVRRPTKWKAVKVILFTLASFVVTWCPYFVASLIYAYCDDNFQESTCETLKVLIASPLAMLGFMNSLINPMIYAWWHKGFRRFMRQKLCGRKGVDISKRKTPKRTTNGVGDVQHHM